MSLSADDFTVVIERLHTSWHKLEKHYGWENVQILTLYGVSYLRITRQLRPREKQCRRRDNDDSRADIAVDEVDDEALSIPRSSTDADLRVVYDIVHSTSYQVPVLYLTFKDVPKGVRPSLGEVYGLLIPDAQETQIRSVGVMGALSMAEHPMTSVPAYFVHPCRTQEAMEPLLNGQKVKPEHYLLLWLGLIAGSVGLNVPIELAQGMVGLSHGQPEGSA